MFTILFVSRSKNVRKLLQLVFEAEGYRVLTTSGSREALLALAGDSADAIVLDVRYPDRDAHRTARKFLQMAPAAELVFYVASDVLAGDGSHGLWTCVRKQADLSELKSAIARLLAGNARSPQATSHSPRIVKSRLLSTT